MKKRYLEAGKIVNTHGIKGEIKIQPWADSPDFLMGFKVLYVDEKPLKVTGARVHKTCLIASFEGVDDVNEAMRLKNKVVFIDREDADLPEDVVFVQDIIGAQVKTEDGTVIGTLKDVLNLPASDVYVIQGEREYMIPAVPEFVLSKDADKGEIIVHLIEGM